ncbi:MAG TPA: L-histidine N(alpha)-methyltransferase [Acidimicrobiales bacterium]|nr:L-histidine N(alpha)-methyltransferase [Acidimicrobiales bacterium]
MSGLTVDVHLGPDDLALALQADALRGLTSTPKFMSPKWLYDERGSQLFSEITRQPEYYPTEAERRLLGDVSDAIAIAAKADTLVELGSGTSDKTRLLLDSLSRRGELTRFVPFDVSEATLRAAGAAIRSEYPSVEVHAVVGDFDQHLEQIPRTGRRLVAFLGSTIGNLGPPDRQTFLRRLAATFAPDDRLLLGVDLVKDVARLEAAYNDAAGVTARFTHNLLTVLNRELDADFDLEGFAHDARWEPEHEWIRIGLRSSARQTVTLRAIDLSVEFAEAELMRTEVSSKFRRDGFAAELETAGFEATDWWDNGDVALTMAALR